MYLLLITENKIKMKNYLSLVRYLLYQENQPNNEWLFFIAGQTILYTNIFDLWTILFYLISMHAILILYRTKNKCSI